ncbi:McKusick-Kaufman/Bardet-Biedl syndromes putative chaperonin-like isoform X1 [Sinocyclocheilus anshuiensis]|uniref:McKusick-Kaufman/Bardet-Biedl syndromes putative chaperonin-like isoform X1 n=1 Tax=Sinocyclocheilus anshuiensis TaxID=1608454 RepID=UPI0007B855D0|nr:PREDICTED: McKusick-Kaufman/Bardet-Biedl syndromes putative chaperonin-like isoform X1 [Sinocyclocheilus anshuiensis]XP_016297835.1 PREDICTED: McKusick-Kaufman/Bardet-Biedl syndromes putative chaperonin-like isoform X1 [Sinocyclocheilus anshuiensis]
MSEPLLKMISTAAQHHTARYSDSGLFMGILMLRLIENTQKYNLRTAAATKVYKHIVEECNTYLKGDSCGCKVPVDFTIFDSLIALAHSMITSKPACMLNSKETQHISSLIAQAFLYSTPCNSSGVTCFGRTVTIGIEGQSVSDSSVFPGLLVDVPEMLQTVDLKRLGSGPFKVVVFNVSLSGDISDLEDVVLEIHRGVDPEHDLLQQLLKLGEQVVKDKVRLFACQKVVHPILHHYLRKHGVAVIERLGLALIEPFVQITGAQAVASLYSSVPAEAYGIVKGFCFQSYGSRVVLQLLPSKDAAVSTMVLCHRNETMLEELKMTCQRAEHVLRLTLREPYALFGGGCTETLLATHINHMNQSKAATTAAALCVSQSEFLMAVEAFCNSLQSVALSLEHDGQDCLIDLTYAHRWVPDIYSKTCGCCLVEDRSNLEKTLLNTAYHTFSPVSLENTDNQPRILDSFSAKLNALNVAVEMANFVLDVKYIIKDIN